MSGNGNFVNVLPPQCLNLYSFNTFSKIINHKRIVKKQRYGKLIKLKGAFKTMEKLFFYSDSNNNFRIFIQNLGVALNGNHLSDRSSPLLCGFVRVYGLISQQYQLLLYCIFSSNYY